VLKWYIFFPQSVEVAILGETERKKYTSLFFTGYREKGIPNLTHATVPLKIEPAFYRSYKFITISALVYQSCASALHLVAKFW
jgi:hypothetical protein